MSEVRPQAQASPGPSPEGDPNPWDGPAASALALGPEWTIAQAAELHTQLLGALQSGEPLTLDLSGVESIDSAGVQLLLALRASLQERDQGLRIASASSAVRAALDLYRLEALLT